MPDTPPKNIVYATAYFRSVRLRDEHFRTIAGRGLGAEIYFQFGWDKLSLPEHKELARTVAGELPACAVHLPYLNFEPGRAEGREETFAELERAMEAVRLYNPDHLIGHPYFDTLRDSVTGVRKFLGLRNGPLDDEIHRPSKRFLDLSLEFWLRVGAACPAGLYLENTHEHSPAAINELIDLLAEEIGRNPETQGTGAPSPYDRVGLCLDVGHWFHYAMGRHWDNLDEWVGMSGPRIRHLHLHDNNGQADQHFGLGQAGLPLPSVWGKLRDLSPPPTITLENHLLESLKQSLLYLERHPLY
ncbi:MAG: sugar phosphate isomerase/epimerase [Deltaproteobacteria bacterium]|jgi:sugar phosphate isomerase/epimerase|nr:sugar phosphate isomerase/epimerase [Deltaproteobacteria bacterium]